MIGLLFLANFAAQVILQPLFLYRVAALLPLPLLPDTKHNALKGFFLLRLRWNQKIDKMH
jgi:hypothetical protein